MSQLPDPTADLDWSGYQGSIQWHFGQNAQNYPDRICVVETKSAEGPERIFSYRQIYEASNTLAHYLTNAGIEPGDVVMIWAHRSVDLVISIMGTLSSGATFSVLDPAYPPSRQKIYLEVAQPRALVNIARATEESGQLAPLVRNYIDTELQLKAEIPALRLGDDGTLFGGGSQSQDLFSQVKFKASSPPDVEVGPDSNPTLSFTSGSEGRPKGVLGRHFSLVYYFSWMAERFNLSSQSRFTLLSGIAHDPVQRDIFTPLFLGAQLLVPSKEDIQHEKLAEWMAEQKPTVTHLTPAMGHILVGGAEAEFPSLKTAFFVGDVLTKRECQSLRQLAMNTNIINMYGTTETQRAVSFYEIPSRAENPKALDAIHGNIPAGKGMKNVQILVVDLNNRSKICDVGEVGEIYVRAAGLAEGYKGDQAMNAEKFHINWFVNNEKWVEADKLNAKGEPWRKYYKGPRDRLYRTGDLGKYLASGDVECTGRADDQVKIRGFRIELNEIDSNLGQHTLVRDCKTLVRRDKDEEPKLVSYIVPEIRQWSEWLKSHGFEELDDDGVDTGPTRYFPKKFRRLQADIRTFLKLRLPDYAIPTVFIMLQKLPLNPNGKIDKPNLPFPDVAEQIERTTSEDFERWKTLTVIEQNVATIWADLLPGINAKTLTQQSNFFDLGGHSIIAQQMLLRIRREMNANISISKLYEFSSLGGISAQIEKLLSKSQSGIDELDDSDTQYARSFDELVKSIAPTFPTVEIEKIRELESPTIFLTGATGFLGAYIIKEILSRTKKSFKVIAHVRGVESIEMAFLRLRDSLMGYGIWQETWQHRISCVVGDLSKPRLGVSLATWKALANDVDIIIHNGATVHWVKRYSELLESNVISTIDAMSLCREGKPKIFTFISSTSVLDTDYYLSHSELNVMGGRHGILESDDLHGSRTGLKTGYGQSKWVSEKLILAAGSRGLCGSIIRPGYILGDQETGVSVTDDFLIRLLKGCIQLSSRPHITNTVNTLPVNHVALLAVAASLNVPSVSISETTNRIHVIHGTAHPRLKMNELLFSLEHYGYSVPECGYDKWRKELEAYVTTNVVTPEDEQHALMPLFHMCIDDLPSSTKAPELNDSNAVSVLRDDAYHWTGIDSSDGKTVSQEQIGTILAYLVAIGFIPKPDENRGTKLPVIALVPNLDSSRRKVGGRGAK
ncbi:BgTH12-01655 [Blumeria graminis f. sp. triticale]|uniref:Alpha-aminoadipate reductase n=3 Tax=Blumeria graminis TaxID=34373 RepID=A0A9X9MEU4_BLUGR|nr:BgTH12-01655 [Blumeria graminis f. sp. triticale]VDB83895.1 Bgt-4945 [Blumeria graminis f. sp. tritici]